MVGVFFTKWKDINTFLDDFGGVTCQDWLLALEEVLEDLLRGGIGNKVFDPFDSLITTSIMHSQILAHLWEVETEFGDALHETETCHLI